MPLMIHRIHRIGLLVILLVCICSHTSWSQILTQLNPKDSTDYTYIPYNRNNLVGFVDRSNRVVIEAAFQNVSFFDVRGIAKAKKNDLYGLIDKKGNIVVPFFGNRDFTLKQPRYIAETSANEKKLQGIYFLNDTKSGEWVMYSEGRKKASALYKYTKSKFDDRLPYYGGKSDAENVYFKYGYRKVEKADSSVNFIDTFFVEVFKNNVVNGVALSHDLFAIYDRSGKAGLVRKDATVVIPPAYYAIDNSGWPGYFIITGMSGGYTHPKGIIDKAGKIIIDTIYQDIKQLDKGLFILTQGGKSGVVDLNGKFILPVEYADIKYFTNGLSYAKKGSDYFVYDQNGKQVSGPFPTIERYSKYPMLTSQRQDSTLFIDSLGKVAFVKPGKFSVREYTTSGIIVVKDNLKGLFSQTGKIFIEPLYDQVVYTWIEDVFMIGKKDSTGLFSPSKGWVVAQKGKPQNIHVQGKNENSPDNIIVIYKDQIKTTYINSLKNIVVDSSQYLKSTSGSYITDTGEQKIIHLPNGTSYTYPKDRSIEVNTNDRVIYFKKRENKEVVILNSKMESVLPPDYQYSSAYEYQGSYVFTLTSQIGKVGIYHLDGRWIYGPVEAAYLSMLGKHVWYLRAKDGQLLNEDFKPISTERYASADIQGSLIHARYKEGNLIDLFSLDGKLLSKGQYSGIHHYAKEQVTLQKSQQGDLLSCVVDTLIKSEICYPYAYLFPLDNNKELFIVKDLYDYGIINRKGEEIYPCIYKDIDYWPDLGLFMLNQGEAYTLIDEAGKTLIDRSTSRIDKQSLQSNYWLVTQKEKNFVIDSKTKKITIIPSSLGRVKVDPKLIRHDLLTSIDEKTTTYIDSAKGIVYNGIQ